MSNDFILTLDENRVNRELISSLEQIFRSNVGNQKVILRITNTDNQNLQELELLSLKIKPNLDMMIKIQQLI